MRHLFAEELYKKMKENDRIYLLTADLGYKMFDEIFKDFPNRSINTGASEQTMLDMAVGLAYSGNLPVCYSITPFLIYRAFETIRTYITHEKLPILLVGSGRDKSYLVDGISHDASDIPRILEALQGLKTYYPDTKEEIPNILKEYFEKPIPTFISLKR